MGSRCSCGAGSGSGGSGSSINTIHTTSGAPSNLVGSNGDYAIDPATWHIYGPKTAGVWPAGVSLGGASGTGITRVVGFTTPIPPGTPVGNLIARVP